MDLVTFIVIFQHGHKGETKALAFFSIEKMVSLAIDLADYDIPLTGSPEAPHYASAERTGVMGSYFGRRQTLEAPIGWLSFPFANLKDSEILLSRAHAVLA
ncbi:hypothetical protein C0991_007208 [Blastosporella zonata]|nr:hypothetical protein C0991_007208 [Blastosporella zonata]